MSKYVLSTMTFSVNYTFFRAVGNLPVATDKITIHGGASIPSAISGRGEMISDGEGRPLWIADGVVTPISDLNADRLSAHPIFKKHQEKGYVKILDADIRDNNKAIKKHTVGMEADGFRQLNTSTISKNIKVTTSFAKTADEFRL